MAGVLFGLPFIFCEDVNSQILSNQISNKINIFILCCNHKNVYIRLPLDWCTCFPKWVTRGLVKC